MYDTSEVKIETISPTLQWWIIIDWSGIPAWEMKRERRKWESDLWSLSSVTHNGLSSSTTYSRYIIPGNDLADHHNHRHDHKSIKRDFLKIDHTWLEMLRLIFPKSDLDRLLPSRLPLPSRCRYGQLKIGSLNHQKVFIRKFQTLNILSCEPDINEGHNVT